MFSNTIPNSDIGLILKHTDAVWDCLSNQTIFLTGGTGFFGRWLLEAILSANSLLGVNIKVIVLTRFPAKFIQLAPVIANDPAIHLLEGDVRSFEFPDLVCDTIIHGATDASADLNEKNPQLMLETIQQGTVHVLNFAVRAQTKRFLLISSGAVYGPQPPSIFSMSERHKFNPFQQVNAYAEGKRLAEAMVSEQGAKQNIITSIARCFAFVGPYLPLNKHFAIGNFIQDVLESRSIHIHSDSSVYRSYLYAADLVIWLLRMLAQSDSSCYNVGSNEEISLLALAERIITLAGSNSEVHVLRKSNLDSSVSRYIPDVSLAMRDLGLKVYTTLDDAILKTIYFNRFLERVAV